MGYFCVYKERIGRTPTIFEFTMPRRQMIPWSPPASGTRGRYNRRVLNAPERRSRRAVNRRTSPGYVMDYVTDNLEHVRDMTEQTIPRVLAWRDLQSLNMNEGDMDLAGRDYMIQRWTNRHRRRLQNMSDEEMWPYLRETAFQRGVNRMRRSLVRDPRFGLDEDEEIVEIPVDAVGTEGRDAAREALLADPTIRLIATQPNAASF